MLLKKWKVAIYNLWNASEDAYNIDLWSKEIISQASALVFQFPLYWMSAPSLLKKWQDEVFTYLAKTRLWQERHYWYGSPVPEYSAYRSGEETTMDELLRPLSGKCPTCRNGDTVVAWNGNGRCRENIAEGVTDYKLKIESLIGKSHGDWWYPAAMPKITEPSIIRLKFEWCLAVLVIGILIYHIPSSHLQHGKIPHAFLYRSMNGLHYGHWGIPAFFRYMKHLLRTMNRFGWVSIHLISIVWKKDALMKYLSVAISHFKKIRIILPIIVRHPYPEKARVSDNRTERVKHAGKGDRSSSKISSPWSEV